MDLNVALIQHAAYDVEHSPAGLERVLALVDDAASEEIDLAVLPECSYPGYYLGISGDPAKAVEHWEDALRAFRDKARKNRFHLVAGIAESDGGRLYNSAFLIDRDGNVAGRARKTFLWHFDSRWFCPGDEYRVFETELGRIGMIVCADGRLPEISRALALKGAQIIADPTNWVTTGYSPSSLTNPQPDAMIPVRAAENGVWFVCANKVGREADSVVYSGRSVVVSPAGEVVKEASPDKEEILRAAVSVGPGPREKAMSLRKEYCSEDCAIISAPNKETPLARILEDPVVPARSPVQVAVVQVDRDISLKDYVQSGVAFISRLAQQGADLVVFPEVPCSVLREFGAPVRDAFRPLAAVLGIHIAIASYGRPHSTTTVLNRDGSTLTFTGVGGELLDVNGLKVGFLRGRQTFVTEEARTLFLKGADLMVWQADTSTGMERRFCMTRAMENRVYVALANCASRDSDRNSMIVSPDGHVLAETFPGLKQAVMAQVSPAISRIKQLVRGTDVFRDRMPGLYQELARP